MGWHAPRQQRVSPLHGRRACSTRCGRSGNPPAWDGHASPESQLPQRGARHPDSNDNCRTGAWSRAPVRLAGGDTRPFLAYRWWRGEKENLSELFVLFYGLEEADGRTLSRTEIAAHLSLAPGAVKGAIRRALRKLRAAPKEPPRGRSRATRRPGSKRSARHKRSASTRPTRAWRPRACPSPC